MKQAAEFIGAGATSVANWETGRRQPAVQQLPRLIQFLGYDPRPKVQALVGQMKRHREARGWSQAEAAAKLGVSATVLWRWETGQRQPKGQYLAKVYSFLGDDPRPAPATIGEKLRRYRENSALTLTTLARQLGVAQSTLCRWESGEREPAGRYASRVKALLENASKTAAS